MKSAKTNQKTIVDRLRPDRTRNKYFKGAERKETILHSTDAIGWRPMEYYIPDRFQQFLSNLDSDIDTLISKAGPDRYNPGYYEKIICVSFGSTLSGECGRPQSGYQDPLHRADLFPEEPLRGFQDT